MSGVYINLSELSEGENLIELNISPCDVNFSYEDVYICSPVYINLRLQKLKKQVFVNAKITTNMSFICSRCLTRYERQSKAEFMIEFIPSSNRNDISESDDVYYYSSENIDISHLVNQTLILSIPMKLLCRADCKGLCFYCGTDLNKGQCECHSKNRRVMYGKSKEKTF